MNNGKYNLNTHLTIFIRFVLTQVTLICEILLTFSNHQLKTDDFNSKRWASQIETLRIRKHRFM